MRLITPDRGQKTEGRSYTESSIRSIAENLCRLPLAVCLILFIPVLVNAQNTEFVRVISPFQVANESDSYDNPFLGGFNAPRPQFVDIDADGNLDLFVQEQNRSSDGSRAGQLIFFENTGTAGSWLFEWRSDFFEAVDVGTWYRFIDIDNDNDYDLFAEGDRFQIRMWRNTGDENVPQFSIALDSLKDINGDDINVELGGFPEWADIDCDGDFDLFYGNTGDGTLTFYQNTGSAGDALPQYQYITSSYQDIMIIGETTQPLLKPDGTARHGMNGFSFSDIDGNGVLDLFWGDQFEPSIVYFKNSGTCETADFNMTARQFPLNQPILTSGFNVPRFADIDGDGDQDMFVALLGGFVSAENFLVDNFLFYSNDGGTAEEPLLTKVSSQFISTLDIGDKSAAALVDIDADGDLDLFLANEEDASELLQSHLYLYENRGSADEPDFVLKTSDYLELDVGQNLIPAFVDIDADEDFDLFMGNFDGKLLFQQNLGTPDSASYPNAPIEWGGIDVGGHCAPAFADIDDDGDFDMFLGEFFQGSEDDVVFRGSINFYENLGDSALPQFVLRDETYFDINVDNYSYPAFTDIDADGDLDLFVGSENARLAFYRNTGSAVSANFEPDSAFSFRQRPRLTPVFADIDNDADLDLISGELGGGLLFYENRAIISAVYNDAAARTIPNSYRLEQNYPNPFNPETVIQFEIPVSQHVRLDIFNALGQRQHTLTNSRLSAGTHQIRWNGSDDNGKLLASGIYFYRITTDSFTKTRKMILLQ